MDGGLKHVFMIMIKNKGWLIESVVGSVESIVGSVDFDFQTETSWSIDVVAVKGSQRCCGSQGLTVMLIFEASMSVLPGYRVGRQTGFTARIRCHCNSNSSWYERNG